MQVKIGLFHTPFLKRVRVWGEGWGVGGEGESRAGNGKLVFELKFSLSSCLEFCNSVYEKKDHFLGVGETSLSLNGFVKILHHYIFSKTSRSLCTQLTTVQK